MNQLNIPRNPNQMIPVQKLVRLQNQSQPLRFDMVKLTFQYKPHTRMIYLNSTLQALVNSGYSIERSQIFLWNPNNKMFMYVGMYPSQMEIVVQSEYFQGDMIQMRYKKIEKCMNVEGEKGDLTKRVKQRSIRQAIDSVRRWMELYELTDNYGKRLHTLQTAAKQIGIAKKTLDDYKTQIRLAEEFKFDFNKNHLMKLGTLRNFNREVAARRQVVNRPPSPEALPLIRICEAEASTVMIVEEEEKEASHYLFHSKHSCYGSSDNGSSKDF